LATCGLSIAQTLHDVINQPRIGGRKLILPQSGGIDPDRIGAGEQPRLARLVRADKGVETNLYVRIIVIDGRQGGQRLDFDVQFLAKFTRQALLDCLTGFDLPAGKLPIPAQTVFPPAPADQDALLAANDRDGDINSFHM